MISLESMKASFGRYMPSESKDDLCRVLVALAGAMQKPNTTVSLTVNPDRTREVVAKLDMRGDFDIYDGYIIFLPEYDWEDEDDE